MVFLDEASLPEENRESLKVCELVDMVKCLRACEMCLTFAVLALSLYFARCCMATWTTPRFPV